MASETGKPRDGAEDVVEAIELAAAEWLVRHDHGLSAEERREFERWRAADSRHARAYGRMRETWGLLDGVPAERVPLPARRRRVAWWLAMPLAAAAAVAVGWFWSGSLLRREPAPMQRAVTPVGGFETLTLSDGSTVRLNTASEIVADYSAQERRVTLRRGEASFEVAKDAARPFIVRVGELEVRAIGTVFNVRRGERAVDVLVMEGRVRVDDAVLRKSLQTTAQASATWETDAATVPLLTAGQRATIVHSPAEGVTQTTVGKLEPAESARALAWHNRELEFSNEPLAAIAAEFNRYNAHRLTIDDPELGAQRFGGKFPANDFASLVRLLELNFGVVVERRENETVLRRKPAGR